MLTEKEIVCRFKDGRELPARRVGAHEPYDLALLKVEATGLVPVVWRDTKETGAGKWVVTIGPAEEPVAIGVPANPTAALALKGTRVFEIGCAP